MIKRAASPNAKSLISHLDEYNFTLPIKHLDWTHNLVLIKQVKDIRARYWYMVHRLHDVLALTGQCKSNCLNTELLYTVLTIKRLKWE